MIGKTLPALLACGAAALAAGSAQADIEYGDTIAIHQSIAIESSPEAIWAEYGGFCQITIWVEAVVACEVTQGDGTQIGDVRTLQLGGDLGVVVEPLLAQGPTSYTYGMTEGFLVPAEYQATIRAEPGPTADSSVVHWSATILAAAYPDDGGVGMAEALDGLYASSLAVLKGMVEE